MPANVKILHIYLYVYIYILPLTSITNIISKCWIYVSLKHWQKYSIEAILRWIMRFIENFNMASIFQDGRLRLSWILLFAFWIAAGNLKIEFSDMTAICIIYLNNGSRSHSLGTRWSRVPGWSRILGFVWVPCVCFCNTLMVQISISCQFDIISKFTSYSKVVFWIFQVSLQKAIWNHQIDGIRIKLKCKHRVGLTLN